MIEVKNLTKVYGSFKAVDNLSFRVKEGEIYGFLGPNGAGKSTTMNIMTGCLSATSGSVKINGYDIFEDATQAKKCIGYLPEIPPLYVDLTPYEYLCFVSEAKGIEKKEIKAEVNRVIHDTQIDDVKGKLIKQLSKGYRQRVGIAQALLGNPKVIILDEPTVGLDPIQIIEIRELIKQLGKKHTVLLSSHILSEVQAICETIMIISKGKLVACNTPEQLEKMFSGTSTIKLICEANEKCIQDIISQFDNIENVQKEEVNEQLTKLIIEFNNQQEIENSKKIFFEFAKRNIPILQMNSVKASLEDIFIELTQEEVQNDCNL